MVKNQKLTESLEDYLEVILELEDTKKVARAKDIAEKLGIKKGSVTGGLKSLAEKELINYEPYSYITLTPTGKKIAREIAHRHKVLKDFFLNILQVDEDTAETTACRIEHAIDKKTMQKFVDFISYLYNCPRTGKDWISAFADFTKSSGSIDDEKCSKCIQDTKIF